MEGVERNHHFSPPSGYVVLNKFTHVLLFLIKINTHDSSHYKIHGMPCGMHDLMAGVCPQCGHR